MPGLTRHTLGREALAGVTLIAIAVPLNIGYAQIAGLPATAGLYSMIVPSIIYAFVVSSRQLVASPDAAGAALVASSVGGLAIAGTENYLTLAFAQAIICGFVLVACSFFKLGFLANFLSKPILVGFVGGIALDILVSQIAKMAGIGIESGSEFIEKSIQLIAGIPSANLPSLLVAVGSLAVLLFGRALTPRVPWALLVLVLATIATITWGLDAVGVSILGPIEAGPPQLTWPILGWMQWLQLVPFALALALVTMAEGLLVSRDYADRRGYTTRPNRDLMAFGLANIASGATGGFTIGSSTSRTAAMDQAGSRTQLPSLIAAGATILLVMFGTSLLENIPSPAIGAIVAVAVAPLLGFGELREVWRLSKFEFAVGLTCMVGVLVIGPVGGVAIAFILSLINVAKRAASPAIDVLAFDDTPLGAGPTLNPSDAVSAPGVIVLRFAAPLFFANATVFGDSVRSAVNAAGVEHVRHVVIDLEAVTDVDVTGSEALKGTTAWLTDHDIAVHYSRVRPGIAQLLDSYGLFTDASVFDTNRGAIEALRTK